MYFIKIFSIAILFVFFILPSSAFASDDISTIVFDGETYTISGHTDAVFDNYYCGLWDAEHERVSNNPCSVSNGGYTFSWLASTYTPIPNYSYSGHGYYFGISSGPGFTGSDQINWITRDNSALFNNITYTGPTPTNPPSQTPIISSIGASTIDEGETFIANGSFIDPDSTSWTATVDYGDGSGAQPLSLSDQNFSLNHTYNEWGTFTVTIKVTDDNDITGARTTTVTVNAVPSDISSITFDGSTYTITGHLDTSYYNGNFNCGIWNVDYEIVSQNPCPVNNGIYTFSWPASVYTPVPNYSYTDIYGHTGGGYYFGISSGPGFMNYDHVTWLTRNDNTLFNNIPTYALNGNIYVDVNRNGIKDSGESGYSHAVVSLASGKTSITDKHGNYSFPNTPTGTYFVTLTTPDQYVETTTNPISIPLTANSTQNFGIALAPTNTPVPTATLTPTETPSPTPLPTNAPPFVEPFANTTIDRGQIFSTSSSFTDSGSTSWTATVDYGDIGGGEEPLTLNPDKTFSLSHQYNTAGEYDITVIVRDNQQATGSTQATVTVVIPDPVTTTFTSSADNYVRSGTPNRNLGAGVFMRLQSSGDNRSLVRFDQTAMQTAIGNKEVLSAKLRLTISEGGSGWGATGRTIDVHRLIANWNEGNGTENDQGTGSGSTWACAADSIISNSSKNCTGSTEWEMGQPNNPSVHPWVQNPTSTQTITNNQTGVVEFDVKNDVIAFLNGTNQNYGWLIKKTNEGLAGNVSFGTKESSSVPQLVITYQP